MFCALAMRRRVAVALLAEGVDRNFREVLCKGILGKSPSSRRAWIEIKELPPVIDHRFGRPPRGGRG